MRYVCLLAFSFLAQRPSPPAPLQLPSFGKPAAAGAKLATSCNSQSRGQMASGSKGPQDDARMGLTREAMAFRVKYRLRNPFGGKIEKNS